MPDWHDTTPEEIVASIKRLIEAMPKGRIATPSEMTNMDRVAERELVRRGPANAPK